MNIGLVLVAFVAAWMVTGVVLASAFGPRLRRCADVAGSMGHDAVLGADTRSGEPLRWILPASIVMMALASSTGLAAAGVLPPQVQVVARSVLGTVGLEVPQPPERPGPGDVATSALAPPSGPAPVGAAGPASPAPGADGGDEHPASAGGADGIGEDESGPVDAPLPVLPEEDGATSVRDPATEPPGTTPPPEAPPIAAPTTTAPTTTAPTTTSSAPPPPSAETRHGPDAATDGATTPTSTTTTTSPAPVGRDSPDVAPVPMPGPAEPSPAPVPSTTVPVPAVPGALSPAPEVPSGALPEDPTAKSSHEERRSIRAEGSSTVEPGRRQETPPTVPAPPPTTSPVAPMAETDAPEVTLP